MRQEQLEERSIIELRSMASAMGCRFEFSHNREKLIDIINKHMDDKVPKPRIPDPMEPADHRTSLRPPRFSCSQQDVIDGLSYWTAKGLVLQFPTIDTWLIMHGKRQDSGTLNAPLRDIMRCARDLMR